ncbi:hypothetical protein POM88_036081 [Heracleum sosnowskyi]|uniref:Uncharacterized protein n=1 Tax=Heracleum sosnowskyi TaxID=360622 RepID=A0AAD8HP46_9APIA|nr:hypothetical protein POM88_036081 [Heracleum sosnowskyi]
MCMIGTVGSAFVYSELRLEDVQDMGYNPLADPPRGEICVRAKSKFAGTKKASKHATPLYTHRFLCDSNKLVRLEGSPHYMKSTSSFDARRERSQVSSQAPRNVMIRKSMSPVKSNNFRHNSDFDVVKPTCSSTLKDSKMPMFLELSTGATESKGTSAMKVCPYTYCSLNGHHHDPQPPLKSFLSENRRMLKAQKGIKLGCLSERRPKPSQERKAKNEKQAIEGCIYIVLCMYITVENAVDIFTLEEVTSV